MTRYRLTGDAIADIRSILRVTTTRFSTRQHRTYRALLREAAELLAADPLRPASRDRGDILPGPRTFHIGHVARRRRAAAHVVLYRIEPDGAGIIITRVLHESMDPAAHIGDTPP